MANRTLIKNEEQAHSLVKHYLGHDFAWDFETTGLSYQHDRPLGLALTFDDERSYYICLEHSIEGEWEGEGRRPSEVYITVDRFRDIVAPLFNQRAPLMVAHNAKFDLHFMEQVGIEVLGRLADTMLAAKLIDENRSVGLKELAWLVGMDLSPYLELEHYQGFKKEEYLGVPLPIASNYAMLDTEATLALWQLFSVQMVEEGVDDVYQRVWIPMLIVLQQMEAKGIALDLEQVRNVREEYVQRASEAEWRIWQEGMDMVLQRYASPDSPSYYLRMATEDELATVEVDEEGKEYIEERGVRLPIILPTPRSKPRVPTFNASSSSQLNELLYEHKGLRPPEGWKLNKTANGGYSSDKNTLKIMDMALEDESPPILKDVLELRKAQKFVGTYLDNFLALADPNDSDCIHTTFNQTTADTGRLSSSNPVNLQNIPSRHAEGKQARAMFVARPNMSLVVADLSQVEVRVGCHYSQDPVMTEAFHNNRDMYVVMAAANNNMPYDELKARVDADDDWAKTQRQIGKVQVLGLQYGMAPPKFRTHLRVETGIQVSHDEAKQLVASFDELYAGLHEWKQKVNRWVHKHGYVKTIYGRKRRLPEIWSNDRYEVMRAERQAVNAIIQGSCADILLESIPAVQQALRPLGGYVLLQIHDELVCEVPDEHAKVGCVIVEQMMTTFANKYLRIPLACVAHAGKTWAEAK